jgi:hypothetical protein
LEKMNTRRDNNKNTYLHLERLQDNHSLNA